MTFHCRIRRQDGLWLGEHASDGVGPIQVKGATRQEAVEKLEREIRYWMEMCPCTGERFKTIDIELVESAS
jgi:hypothetical protein